MSLLGRIKHWLRYGSRPAQLQLATDEPVVTPEIPRYQPYAILHGAAAISTNNIHPLTLGICVGLMQRR